MPIEFYATVTGAKQGAFKPEGSQSALGKGKIPGIAFGYSVVSPRDPTSGLPTGKRQHQPVTFTKEWGASSPQFYQAVFNNENLTSVLFEFIGTGIDGKDFIDHTIKLTNASIASVSESVHDPEKGGPVIDSRELQTITFTFQKIDIASNSGKTDAMDDWSVST
jgi:type VI secretion system secreted protein Hcp